MDIQFLIFTIMVALVSISYLLTDILMNYNDKKIINKLKKKERK